MIEKRDATEIEEKPAEEKLLTVEQDYDTELIRAFQKTVNKVKKQFGITWLEPSLMTLHIFAVMLVKENLINAAMYDAIMDDVKPALSGAMDIQI